MAKDSFAFLTKYLATFSSVDEESYNTYETKEEAVRAIVEFVKSPDMFQVSNLRDLQFYYSPSPPSPPHLHHLCFLPCWKSSFLPIFSHFQILSHSFFRLKKKNLISHSAQILWMSCCPCASFLPLLPFVCLWFYHFLIYSIFVHVERRGCH